MLHRSRGFTIIELLIVISVIALLSIATTLVFNSSLRDLFKMNATMVNINDQVVAMQRMEQVLRGGTRITEATTMRLTIFSYFSPQDATLSQITYYYNATSKKLLVDRIPASGSPPNYTYNNSDKKTLTLISDFVQTGDIFTYFDANGDSGVFTGDQLKDIKKITISLKEPARANIPAAELTSSVILRNRKTNL